MFSGQSFLHRLSVALGSGPDRTTSHFLIKTTLISFLVYYTECSITKLFLYSRSLHYYFLYPFYISLTFTVVSAVLRLLGAPGHISTGDPSPSLLPFPTPPSIFCTSNLIASRA